MFSNHKVKLEPMCVLKQVNNVAIRVLDVVEGLLTVFGNTFLQQGDETFFSNLG